MSYLSLSTLVQMGTTIGLLLLAFAIANFVVWKIGKAWLLLPIAATGLILLLTPAKAREHQVALTVFCGMGGVLLNCIVYDHLSPQLRNRLSYVLIPFALAFIVWRRFVVG